MSVIDMQADRCRRTAAHEIVSGHRGEKDLLEVRRYGTTWSVALVRPYGMPPVGLADFDDAVAAEQFARHVADVRGDTGVRRSLT